MAVDVRSAASLKTLMLGGALPLWVTNRVPSGENARGSAPSADPCVSGFDSTRTIPGLPIHFFPAISLNRIRDVLSVRGPHRKLVELLMRREFRQPGEVPHISGRSSPQLATATRSSCGDSRGAMKSARRHSGNRRLLASAVHPDQRVLPAWLRISGDVRQRPVVGHGDPRLSLPRCGSRVQLALLRRPPRADPGRSESPTACLPGRIRGGRSE